MCDCSACMEDGGDGLDGRVYEKKLYDLLQLVLLLCDILFLFLVWYLLLLLFFGALSARSI